MAARPDILEKIKKSKAEAEQRMQANKELAERQKAKTGQDAVNVARAEARTAAVSKKVNQKKSTPASYSSQPVSYKTDSTKWYKGDSPTEVEALARIAQVGREDEKKGRELYGYYEQAKQEGMWAETYDKATSSYMTSLGLTPDQVNEDFFLNMLPEMQAGTLTAAGNQSSGKKNKLAYELEQLRADWTNTVALENESNNMAKEIQYWVDQGLTDDEIRQKVALDGAGAGKYKKLSAAQKKTLTGEVEPTTKAIAALTSYGVDGMIWAARNPGKSTGDYKLDAVQGAMGRGVQHTSTPEEIARRTPGSDSWAPYASGTTMHDAAIMFGVGKSFAPDWIDKNAQAIIASGDETAQAMLAKIDSAEKFTRQAEAELASLNRSIETAISADPTADPDEIIERVFGSADSPAFAALAEMDNTFRTGKVLNTTRGVGYDRKAIEADIRARSAEAQKKEAALTDPAVMNEVVSEQKSAAVQENGGTLLTPGKVEESVPEEAKVSIMYGSGLDPEQIQQGFDKIAAWISSRVEKNRKKRAEKIQQEQETEAAEAEKKMEYSETITGPSASTDTPEPIAVIASAGASDVSTKAPSAPILSREELAAAQDEIYALEAEGRYEEAAKAQFPLIVSAVTNSDDEYVKELVTSVGAQEAAVHLTSLILQGDMLNQVDDLDVWDTVSNYEYYVCKVLDIDTASADMIAQAMDFVTGGAYSQTEDNAGVGVLRTVESTAVQGMAKANDLWANIAGAVMTGYGHVVKGTNDLINNTLGKLFDFEIQDTLADKTIESGQNLATHYDKIQANEDAVMREYATPMEYFTASAGSEAVKMGVQSVAGSAVVGKVVPSVTQVMTGKDGLKTLQTAMDLAKIEGLTSKVAAATPFIADSMASDYNATYAETKNPVTALLTSVVSGFATTAIMNVDAIKNIESMGKLIPEVVDTLKAVPGVGMLANAKRYGKMGMMYIGNMFKTAANEAIQEPTESLLKTWVTDTLKGKDFFEDRDWKAFGAELASDAFYAAIGTFGNTMASLPSWSRSATYANQMMGKTGLTAQEVVGQIDAFIEDMNDPQVVAQLEANLNETAVEARTGELVSEGALAPVDTSAVTIAEQKVAEAEEVLVDAEIALTQATAESDAALAKFQENPSDENTKRLSAALAAENKAKQDQEKASAGLQKSQTALGEAQSATKAQSEAAIGTVRAQAQAEVEQASKTTAESRKAEPVVPSETISAPNAEAGNAVEPISSPATSAPAGNMPTAPITAEQSTTQTGQDTAALEQEAEPVTLSPAEQVMEYIDDVVAQEVEKYKEELDKGNEEFREKYLQKREELAKRGKYRNQIRKGVADLVRMVEKPTGKKHVIAGLDAMVVDFLKELDLGTRGKKAVALGEKIRNVAATFAENNANPDAGIVIDPDIIESMSILAKETAALDSFGKLTTEQMRDLRDMVASVKHIVKNADKMFTSKRNARISDVGERSVQQISQKADYKAKEGMQKKMKDLLNVGMLDSFHFFDTLGSASKEVFNGVREGLNKKTKNIQTAVQYVRDTVSGADKALFLGDKAPKTEYKTESGATIELTKPQVMELYCLNKRDAAKRHLLYGGIRTSDNVAGVKLTESDIDAITSSLSESEREIADKLQQFMSNQCSEWGNETSMAMSGYRKFREKNYYPMKVDENTVKTSQDLGNKTNDLYAVMNKGFTKDLRHGAANQLLIGDIFDTFSQYVDDVTTYNAYAAPVYDMIRWFNYKPSEGVGLKTVLEQKIGTVGRDYIPTLIRDLNGGTGHSYSPGIAEDMTRRAKSASIGANIRVAIQQPTAIARAAMVMNPKYIVAGAKATPKALNEAVELAKKYCPIAAWKSMGFYETNIGNSLQELMFPERKSLKDKTTEVGMWLPGKMDELTFGALWRACEKEVTDGDSSLTGEELYQAVGKRLSEVIDYTQVVDTPLHRTQLMRSKNTGVQMATSFMTEPAKTYNMLQGAITQAKANPDSVPAKKQVSRALAVYTTTALLNAVAQSLWDGVRDDEDDEYLEKVGHALIGNYEDAETIGDYAKIFMGSNVGSSLNPLNTIPFVKDIISMMQGYEPTRLDLQAVSKVIKLVKQVPKVFNGESEWNAYQWIRSTASAFSYAYGIPADNLIREMVSVYNTAAGILGGEKIVARTQPIGITEQAEHIYDAIVSGDKEAFDKWVKAAKNGEKPKNDNDIDLKVAEILANEDDRIAEAGAYRNAGRATEVNRIGGEVVADLANSGVISVERAVEIVDKAIKNYAPKQETKFDPDKQLNAELYASKDVASAVFAMAGANENDVTPEDIQLMISELTADSSAKDPAKQVATNIRNAAKEMYAEYVNSGADKEAIEDLDGVLMAILSINYPTLEKWKAYAESLADE